MVTAAGAGKGGGRGEGGARGGRAWASGQPPRGRGLGRCWEPSRLVGRREGLHPARFHSPLSLHAPFLAPGPSPYPLALHTGGTEQFG